MRILAYVHIPSSWSSPSSSPSAFINNSTENRVSLGFYRCIFQFVPLLPNNAYWRWLVWNATLKVDVHINISSQLNCTNELSGNLLRNGDVLFFHAESSTYTVDSYMFIVNCDRFELCPFMNRGADYIHKHRRHTCIPSKNINLDL